MRMSQTSTYFNSSSEDLDDSAFVLNKKTLKRKSADSVSKRRSKKARVNTSNKCAKSSQTICDLNKYMKRSENKQLKTSTVNVEGNITMKTPEKRITVSVPNITADKGKNSDMKAPTSSSDADTKSSNILLHVPSETENKNVEVTKKPEMNSVPKKENFLCPLCWKTCENKNSHMSHMKQCAKKKKLTTQQLIDALELQKKQLEERSALGLSQIPKKETSKSIKSNTKKSDAMLDYETALAIAVSKSESEFLNQSSSTSAERSCDNVQTARTRPTLETFGFTSSQQAADYGSCFGKRCKSKFTYSILKTQTKEERERIMTEKAAIILLDDIDNKDEDSKRKPQTTEQKLTSTELIKLSTDKLWSIGGEDNADLTWYVKDLSEIIKEPVNNNEINNSVRTQTTSNNETDNSVLADDSQSIEDNSRLEISITGNPLQESWKKLLNSEDMCDYIFETSDNCVIHAHKLVFFVRCPQILKKNSIEIFKKFSYTVVMSFLEYLYCNTLNNLLQNDVKPLFELANIFDNTDLIEVLKSADEKRNNLKQNPSSLRSKLSESSDGEFNDTQKTLIFNHSLLKESKHGSNKALVDSTLIENDLLPNENTNVQSERKTQDHDVGSALLTNDIDILSMSSKDSNIITESESNSNVFPVLFPEEENERCAEMIDLTQSSTRSNASQIIGSTINEKNDSDDSNLDKSFWSFIQNEKKKRELELLQKKEEEKENYQDISEAIKISHLLKLQSERLAREDRNNQIEEEKISLENSQELEKIYRLESSLRSLDCDNDVTLKYERENRSTTSAKSSSGIQIKSPLKKNHPTRRSSNEVDLFKEEIIYNTPVKNKAIDIDHKLSVDYIVLSSDSEQNVLDASQTKIVKESIEINTNTLNNSNLEDKSLQHQSSFFDPPPFDEFDCYNYEKLSNDFGDLPEKSQSLISGNFSPASSNKRENKNVPQGEHKLDNSIRKEQSLTTSKPEDNMVFNKIENSALSSPSEMHAISSHRLTETEAPDTVPASDIEICSSLKYTSENINHKRKKSDRNFDYSGEMNTSVDKDKGLPKTPKKTCGSEDIVLKPLTDSVLNEFNQSFFENVNKICSEPAYSSTPLQKYDEYVEVTPKYPSDLEYTTRVTPLPDYSGMKTEQLKKHLSKYGLKKNLGKNKAKKILRYIYDELHPVIDTKTGKIVQNPPDIGRKKKKRKSSAGVPNSKRTSLKNAEQKKLVKRATKNSNIVKKSKKTVSHSPQKAETSSKESEDLNSSLDKSSASSGESEGFSEPESQILTQCTTLQSAFFTYIQNNPLVHQKILLYESLWLEELQKSLHVSSQKKFKLNDLMDFLDKKCITFRSQAQARNNHQRKEKKIQKRSPKKKSGHAKTDGAK